MFASFKKRLQRIICILAVLVLNKAVAQPKFLQPELDINNGLKSNTIRVIQKCSRDNSIWIGTEDGLTVLNDNDSSCKNITSILRNQPVWTLAFYKNNAIIGTRFKGIYFFDLITHTIIQHIDSSKVDLCRRLKVIGDTVFVATATKTFYLTFTNKAWKLHNIVTNINNGFVTDFAKFNNKIYATAYAPLKSKLSYFKNDSLYLMNSDGEMNNEEEINHYFTLYNTDSLLVLGGSISYSIFGPKNNNQIKLINHTKLMSVRPIWDVAIAKKNIYLASGNPSNLQEGMIVQPGISTINDISPNFYGQSLYYDDAENGLWCGTLNRGLFFWPHVNESYKIPNDQTADFDFIPANQDSIIIYNKTKASLCHLNESIAKPIKNLSLLQELKTLIKDVCISNDSVFVLYNSKVVIHVMQSEVWEFKLPIYKMNIFDKIQYINGKILLFSQYAEQILSIDTKTKRSTFIKASTNLTSNKKIGKGLIYFSNYSGFYYFDTVAHPLNLPILNAESFDLLHDSLFFCQGGVISGYKINVPDFSATPLFIKSLKDLIPQFMPRWVISNSGKLYCGDSKGLLEINANSGEPIRYIYLGNYSEDKEPKSLGRFIYINHNNYLTRINPSEENTKINKTDFTIKLMPAKDLEEKNPFSLHVLSPNFLLQSHALKRLDLLADGVIIKQYYTLSDEFNFPIGLGHGRYTVNVFVNNIFVKEIDLKISVPLQSNPYFYISITLILLSLGFLLFKMTLNKRLYQKHILENRLQLLKQNLNPHFIFNSLNLIYSLVLQQKNESAIKAINQFSDLHRYYLDNINKPKVSLEEELSFIKSYLQLESARVQTDDRLSYFLPENLHENIKNVLVPPMILQPLVENAVKYSYANTNEKRTIWVDVTERPNHLVIGIENTLSENTVGNHSGNGLGLKMVSERIDIFNKTYNESVKISIEQLTRHAKRGYRCELVFPV